MNYKNREKIIAHSIFLLGSIIVLYPFFSILFLALSEPGKRISGFTVPSGFYFDNFIKAWTDGGFSNGLFNSFVVVFGVVSVTIFCSTLAAYAFEKLDIFGVTPLFALLLIGLVLPYESIVISLYYTMKTYNLTNTYWALILPQIGLSIPFRIFDPTNVEFWTPKSYLNQFLTHLTLLYILNWPWELYGIRFHAKLCPW